MIQTHDPDQEAIRGARHDTTFGPDERVQRTGSSAIAEVRGDRGRLPPMLLQGALRRRQEPPSTISRGGKEYRPPPVIDGAGRAAAVIAQVAAVPASAPRRKSVRRRHRLSHELWRSTSEPDGESRVRVPMANDRATDKVPVLTELTSSERRKSRLRRRQGAERPIGSDPTFERQTRRRAADRNCYGA
jgi:hypothetical protein